MTLLTMPYTRPPRASRKVMGPLSRTLLVLLLLLTFVVAAAQSAPVQRVVVMPFEGDSALATYTLGLPTALQRSLNEIPGTFVPAVGDVALVMQKAREAGLDIVPTVRKLFSADIVIEGTLLGAGGSVGASLRIEKADATTSVTVSSGDGTPAGLARAAAAAVAKEIKPDLGATVLGYIDSAAAQTPSLPGLGPVALAASRLPGARTDDLATALQLDPDSAWLLSEYARLLAIAGNADDSIAAAKKAVAAQPTDIEAQTILGIVLAAANQDAAAKAAFEAAIALNPAHAVALTGLARLESDAGKATSELEAALAAYPRMVDAYLQLATLQSSDQRAAQVLRRGEAALPESLVLRRAIVQRVVAAGDASGALAYLQQAVKDPMAASAALYALVRYLPTSMSADALALLKQGQQAFPDSLDLKATEGDLLLAQGKDQEAEAILAPLNQQAPKNLDVANLLAVAQARQGKVDAATATFQAAAGTGRRATSELGQLLLAAGRSNAAIDVLRPLAEADGAEVDTLTFYGIALGRVGKIAEAKKVLQSAIALDPKASLAQRSLSLLEQQDRLTGGTQVTFTADAGTTFQQGLYALEVQDYQAAAAAFARARAADDNGLVAFYAGYTKQLQGDPRGAVADYEVAVKAFPESDIVLNNLGYAHLQLGRFDLALTQLKAALTLNPDNPQANLNLGLTYFGLGRWQDALDSFAKAVTLDPSLEAKVSTVRDAAQKRVDQEP